MTAATKSIYIDDDLAAIRAQTRQYVEREIVPRAGYWEEAGVPRAVLKEMAGLGFFGLRAPVEHGGLGMGALASVVFAEELGRSTFGGFSITVVSIISTGAGSVAVSARPSLPKTRSTSGNSFSFRSICCTIQPASRDGRPGSVVGM